MDCDLISYYSVEEVLPYAQYRSGAKDGDKAIYHYSAPSKTYPVLMLEQDILLGDGRGIMRGFYQAVLSDDFDFIMLLDTGRIVAKVPVVSLTQRKEMPLVREKKKKKLIKPPEGKQYKPPHKMKNNKGVDSDDFIYLKAAVYYDDENDNYVVIYERGNTKAVGVIRK